MSASSTAGLVVPASEHDVLRAIGTTLSQAAPLQTRLTDVLGILRAAWACDIAASQVPQLHKAEPVCAISEQLGDVGRSPAARTSAGPACVPAGWLDLLPYCALLLAGDKPPPLFETTPHGTWWLHSLPRSQATKAAGASKNEDEMSEITLEKYATLVCVPIKGNNSLLGVLSLGARRPDTINADQVACLEIASMMAGLAIQEYVACAALRAAHDENALFRQFMPICAHCKKIQDDDGYWNEVEVYMLQHFDASFSHGICPECLAKHYPQLRMRESD